MHKEAKEELRIRLKLVVLELAHHFGATKSCREFNIPRSSIYRWKQKYDKEGQSGLYRERLVVYSHPCKPSPEAVVEAKLRRVSTEKCMAFCSLLEHLGCPLRLTLCPYGARLASNRLKSEKLPLLRTISKKHAESRPSDARRRSRSGAVLGGVLGTWVLLRFPVCVTRPF